METENYQTQVEVWPASGRHILAHYDSNTITVYQAFRPQIADEAVQLGRFGPSFSLSRMSWIKPSFLWMMFRCGWARKVGQERVLQIQISLQFFERVLAAAVPSWFDSARYRSTSDWAAAVRSSHVRTQWDPDHDPAGRVVARRAIQIGLRRAMLAEYASEAILGIKDITPFVVQQRDTPLSKRQLPRERLYRPMNGALGALLGLDQAD